MKRLVMDLDGTICEQVPPTEDGSTRDYASAKSKELVIEWMRWKKSDGWHITIFTARGALTQPSLMHVEANIRPPTEKWLKDHGVPYDALVFGKPPADLYVDDKCVNVEDLFETEPMP